MINYLSHDVFSNVIYYSLGINGFAICLFVFLVAPLYLEIKNSRRTYGVETKFFKSLLFGGVFVWLNSLVTIIGKISDLEKNDNTKDFIFLAVFCIFLVFNSTFVYVSHFCLKVKKENLEGAAKLGISEQEYWEKYIQPNL